MMMKWLVRLAFPALGVLLLLIVFGLNAPEQVVQPLAKESKPSDIPAFETLVPDSVAVDTSDIVFKWQDTEGNWHYADQPPAQGSWNTLAIERPDKHPNRSGAGSGADWQAPYSAPFNMGVGASGS